MTTFFAESSCMLNGQPIACAELAEKAKPFIGLGIGLAVVILVLVIAAFVFWLMMLLHALKYNSPDKGFWLTLLIVSFFLGFSFIAALVYYFAEKKKAEATGISTAPLSMPHGLTQSQTGTSQPPTNSDPTNHQ